MNGEKITKNDFFKKNKNEKIISNIETINFIALIILVGLCLLF